MKKKGHIASYSADEVAAMRAGGADRTDWQHVDAMTEAELEAAIATDADAETGPVDWAAVEIGLPRPKQAVHIRLDADVLEWFKRQGRGYQTRVNAVLRAYYESHRASSGRHKTPHSE